MIINFKVRYTKASKRERKQYMSFLKRFDHRVSMIKCRETLRDPDSIKWRYPRSRRQEFAGFKKKISPRVRYYPTAKILYESIDKEHILRMSDKDIMDNVNTNAVPTNIYWYSKKYQFLRTLSQLRKELVINKIERKKNYEMYMEKMNFEYNKGDDENGNHNK